MEAEKVCASHLSICHIFLKDIDGDFFAFIISFGSLVNNILRRGVSLSPDAGDFSGGL